MITTNRVVPILPKYRPVDPARVVLSKVVEPRRFRHGATRCKACWSVVRVDEFGDIKPHWYERNGSRVPCRRAA